MTATELFSKYGCPDCSTTRLLLMKLGLSFREYDTAHDPCAEELKHRMSSRKGPRAKARRRHHRLPQLFVNGEPVGDNDALLRMAEDGRLDSALDEGEPCAVKTAFAPKSTLAAAE